MARQVKSGVVAADPSKWSPKSQQTISFHYIREYSDISYNCWRCKKAAVFTAEDQRYTYEIKKAPIDQRRILCEECWKELHRIDRDIKSCQQSWSESKKSLKLDKEFLANWLQLLVSRAAYVPYHGNRPVIYVSWHYAQQFIVWLNKKTGRTYRLPTESGWEYAARAGTPPPYYWGEAFDSTRAANDHTRTEPIGAHPPNAFGLYDMAGNVWQCVEDCNHDSYANAPTDGSAWTTGDCTYRVSRGGAWINDPTGLRVSYRASPNALGLVNYQGFRLAQDQ